MADDLVLTSAAPGDLELVRRFVNTYDVEQDTDEIGSPADAAAWLAAQGHPAKVGARELAELAAMRELLRDLVSERGTTAEATAAAGLDAIGRKHPVAVRVSSPQTLVPTSRDGTGTFIERILGLVASARIDGSWGRMKACANHGCRWVFYDHSRNRSRTWCTMNLCGSQAKMRAYRSRRASRPPR